MLFRRGRGGEFLELRSHAGHLFDPFDAAQGKTLAQGPTVRYPGSDAMARVIAATPVLLMLFQPERFLRVFHKFFESRITAQRIPQGIEAKFSVV
jgi:hypothetical protein